MITVDRYHDFSCGHRVVGHEGKCALLHGHNYRVTFTVEAPKLDGVGRVLDFSVIKSRLCAWLEDEWDHRFLAWERDQALLRLLDAARHEDALRGTPMEHRPLAEFLTKSIVWVPFNPTAENMAEHLVLCVGPQQLEGTGCVLTTCQVEETRKCSATFNIL